MTNIRRTYLFRLALLILVGLSSHGVAARAVDLVVLHVNDSHGDLYPHFLPDSTEAGGIARAATLIKAIRSRNPGRVMLLHGGDIFSRGEPVTIRTGGGANLRLMEQIGFDVTDQTAPSPRPYGLTLKPSAH